MIDPEGVLTRKQRHFVVEYWKDKNGTRAALAAGYAKRSAHSTATVLLKNPKVIAELDRLENEVRERVDVTREDLIRVLWGIVVDPETRTGCRISATDKLARILGAYAPVKLEAAVATEVQVTYLEWVQHVTAVAAGRAPALPGERPPAKVLEMRSDGQRDE